MTNTATLSLTNAHGLFAGIDPKVLDRALKATTFRADTLIRHQAATACGHPDYDWMAGAPGPLDDCTRIEVLMIWIESGNHSF